LNDWLRRIHQAATRLQGLVDQMIKLLLKGRFDYPLNRRPTELALLLQDAAEQVRPFVERRRQELVLDLAADLGQVNVEADKIRDGVDHLLLNAIKFTPDGGQITLAASRTAEGGAEVRISDTGIGIDAASLPRIFDPFFTGFNVSRHSSGHFEYGRRGLGLGLSVVKLFVEMHGGTIGVASEPGHGTTFRLTLPSAEGSGNRDAMSQESHPAQ
jgi:signal transduction histidine kinase